MLKYLSDNLNMLMSRDRLSSNELARQINIPATTIKRIRNNEQANPTITTLLPIAHYFSISLNQLIGNEPLLSKSDNYPIVKLHKIPLLSWQKCVQYASLDYEQSNRQIFTERYVSAKSFALLIEDNDLEFFPKDSILIVDPEKKPESGDYVVIGNIEQNNASVRKYIIEIDRIYLKPLVFGIGISILTPQYKILGVIIQYKVELKSEIKQG
jgi:SOS-response transcriptional repressor LexA